MQEGCARDQGGDPERDVRSGAASFERVEDLLLRDTAPRTAAGGEEEDGNARRDRDPALEAAARRDEPEGCEPDPDEHDGAGTDDAEDTQRVAANPVAGDVGLRGPARLTEQQDDADDCREEDQLLAHRVDPAVVEDDRGHGVRNRSRWET